MIEQVQQVNFDRGKHPGMEFEILTLENILYRKDMDHNQLNTHQISFYVLMVITDGHGRHTIDFEDYPYKKGSVLTIRKDQIHSFHAGKANGYVLLFTEEFVLSYMEQTGSQKIKEVFNELLFRQATDLSAQDYEEMSVVLEQIDSEFNQYADVHSSSIIRNLLQVLVSKLHRIRNTSSQLNLDHKYIPQFFGFQKLVEQHCTESRSVTYYADQLGLTTKTLNNITQKIIDKAPKAFIDEILVLKIKRELINSHLSVKEIAYRSGFGEPTNLFKFFKRYTGYTPESFRTRYSREF
ncbi:MAG: helix-turn-helix transcriptional regulator [Bacteroidota bacterium]